MLTVCAENVHHRFSLHGYNLKTGSPVETGPTDGEYLNLLHWVICMQLPCFPAQLYRINMVRFGQPLVFPSEGPGHLIQVFLCLFFIPLTFPVKSSPWGHIKTQKWEADTGDPQVEHSVTFSTLWPVVSLCTNYCSLQKAFWWRLGNLIIQVYRYKHKYLKGSVNQQ